MTEVHTDRRPATPPSRRRGNPVSRFFASIALFLRQTLDELRKVVRPTREELLTYTLVVLIFVIAVMVYVSILDFGIGKLVFWVFAG